MISGNTYTYVKTQRVLTMCNICGCKIKHLNNFNRHLKARRQNEVDYINNNRFATDIIKPKIEENNDLIIIIR